MLEVQVGIRSSVVVTIKNMSGAATSLLTATIPTTNGFYITSSTCSNKSLPPNGGSCSLTMNFSGVGKTAGVTYQDNLVFGSSSILVKIKVIAPPPPPPAQLAFFDGTTQLSAPLALGPYPNDVTLSKTLSVKNIGSSASSTLSLQLLNNVDGWYLSSNSCNNVALAAGASCSFSLRVSTTGKAEGLHSVQLKMDQTTQDVNFSRPPSVLAFYETTTEISSVHMADLTTSQSIVKNYSVKLKSGASSPALSLSNSNPDFVISNSSCDNRVITYTTSCAFKVTFNAAGKSVGSHSSSLAFGNAALSLSTEIFSAVSLSPSSLPPQASGSVVSITAQGGKPPYTYSTNSIISSIYDNDVLTIGQNPNTANITENVRVVDSLGQVATFNYQVLQGDNGSLVYVQIGYPYYGRIISADGNINCGDGEDDCYYEYPFYLGSVQLSIVDLPPHTIINGVYNFGDNYIEYGSVTSFTLDLTQEEENEMNIQVYAQEDQNGLLQVEYPQSGRITSGDTFINCGNGFNDCKHHYDSATAVTLSMNDLGSTWTVLNVYDAGTTYQNLGTSYPVVVNMDVTTYSYVYAEMEENTDGQIEISPPSYGRIVSSDGLINCGPSLGHYDCSRTYDALTTPSLQLSVVDIQPGFGVSNIYNVGNQFVNYGATSPITADLTNGKVIIQANFYAIPASSLVINLRGGDGAERVLVEFGSTSDFCEGVCSYTVPGGALVTLTAVQNSGKAFASWDNCPTTPSTPNICSFNIAGLTDVAGVFDYAYTVTETDITAPEVFGGYTFRNFTYSASGNDLIAYNHVSQSSTSIKTYASTPSLNFFPLDNNNAILIDQSSVSTSVDVSLISNGGVYYRFTFPNCPQPQISKLKSGYYRILECVNYNISPNLYRAYLLNFSNTTFDDLLAINTDSIWDTSIVSFDFNTKTGVVYNAYSGQYVFHKFGVSVINSSFLSPTNYLADVEYAAGKIFYRNAYQMFVLDPATEAIQSFTSSGGDIAQTNGYLYVGAHHYSLGMKKIDPNTLQSIPLASKVSSDLNCSSSNQMIRDQNGDFNGIFLCANNNNFSAGYGKLYLLDLNTMSGEKAIQMMGISNGSYMAGGPFTKNGKTYFGMRQGIYRAEMKRKSGTFYAFDPTNVRASRQFFKFDTSVIPEETPGEYNSIFEPLNLIVLDDGTIIIDLYYRMLYSGSNVYKRIRMVPNP